MAFVPIKCQLSEMEKGPLTRGPPCSIISDGVADFDASAVTAVLSVSLATWKRPHNTPDDTHLPSLYPTPEFKRTSHYIRYRIELALNPNFDTTVSITTLSLPVPILETTSLINKSDTGKLAPNNAPYLMDRPAKRQKLSPQPSLIIPTRTIDLESFQRQNRRRSAGKILLPRVPDVTVTSAVLEVAVNGGSTTTQIAVPTTDVAVTLTDLGTLIIPGVASTADSATASPGASSNRSSPSSQSQLASVSQSTVSPVSIVTSTNHNSTTFSASGNTVIVTATSTFHVSYSNGSFLPVTTTTKKTSSIKSTSEEDTSTDTDTDKGTYSSTATNLLSSLKFTSTGYSKYGSSQTTSADATATDSGTSYYNNNNNNNAAIGATGTETSTAAQPTGSSGSDSGTTPPVLSPQQTRMVGGVVGGIAGIAMILIALLYVLRWYRERLKKQGRLPEKLASSHNSRDFSVSGLVGCAAPMSQSITALFPVPAGPGMKKWRPGGDMTMLTNATSISTSDSETGFQRVSGRKIPSVLTTGGDQFGGSYGAFEKESGTLFRTTTTNPYFSDSDSVHGYTPPHRPPSRSAPTTPVYPAIFAGETTALRSPTATSPQMFGHDEFRNAFGCNITKPDGIAVFHSSPARTPMMQSPNTSTLRLPSQAPVTMDEDIPEMPLPSPGMNAGIHNIGIAIGTGVGAGRVPHGTLSSRNGASNGRFREDMR